MKTEFDETEGDDNDVETVPLFTEVADEAERKYLQQRFHGEYHCEHLRVCVCVFVCSCV